MNDNIEKKETSTPVEGFIEIMPLVDILDSNDGVTMYFEVPGANRQNIDIEVKDGVMAIKAVSALRRNGKSIVFKRQFRMADSVDIGRITAQTQDGVLTLTIPKSEEAKIHKIKVS